jgi:uncharacterized protein (TIGR03435 family)
MRQRITVAVLALFSVSVLLAQQTPRPNFEVASIKESKTGEHSGGVYFSPGGHLSAKNVPLHFLIANAWHVKSFQITGGPGWFDTTTWNIEAKGEGNPSPQQIMLMLQSLLEDRFQLKVQRRTVQHETYSLLAARTGAKLKATTKDCQAPGSSCDNWSANDNDISGEAITIEGFAGALAEALDLPVADQTGLQGRYDIKLHWAPSDTAEASIFTAIQEQLGLKLQSQKGPVEMLVIEHLEKPTEN